MSKRRSIVLLPLSVAVLAMAMLVGRAIPASATEPPEPLALRNLSPLYANLGVPVMAGAWLPEAGAWQLSLQTQIASHSLRERSAAGDLELDGETRRIDLQFAWSPSERLRLGLNLPWVQHSGGALDGLIDDWHGLWGLPEGARDEQDQDQLLYLYSVGGETRWRLDNDSSGIGDIELSADLALHSDPRWALSALASVKLASGDRDDFTGSGEAALALGLRGSRSDCLLEGWQCHGQVGVLYAGDNPLDPRARDWLPFYAVSLAWPLTSQLALLAQLEGQGETYRSAALDAAGAPVLGALGLRWITGSGWRIDALFSEDLNVGSAPDITFQLGLRRSW